MWGLIVLIPDHCLFTFHTAVIFYYDDNSVAERLA